MQPNGEVPPANSPPPTSPLLHSSESQRRLRQKVSDWKGKVTCTSSALTPEWLMHRNSSLSRRGGDWIRIRIPMTAMKRLQWMRMTWEGPRAGFNDDPMWATFGGILDMSGHNINPKSVSHANSTTSPFVAGCCCSFCCCWLWSDRYKR